MRDFRVLRLLSFMAAVCEGFMRILVHHTSPNNLQQSLFDGEGTDDGFQGATCTCTTGKRLLFERALLPRVVSL